MISFFFYRPKSIFVLIVLLTTYVFSVSASAELVRFNLSFELDGGDKTATSGSFEFDTNANIFTEFTTEWDGRIFDLTSSANDPRFFGSGQNSDCIDGLYLTISPATSFDLLTQNLSGCTNYRWQVNAQGPLAVFNFIAEDASGLNTVSFRAGDGGLVNSVLHYGSYTATAVPLPGTLPLYFFALAIFRLISQKYRR